MPSTAASAGPDLYRPVPHSHIVPVGYLRAWAHGRQIALRRPGRNDAKLIGVRDAGVRRSFYRRLRPSSGQPIYDIEWSMSVAENEGLPVVRDIAHRWPLSADDKGRVGQLLALQYLRGPLFAGWHDCHVEAQIAELQAAPAAYARPGIDVSPEEAVERQAEHMRSASYRHTHMLKITRSVGIVFTSMHWTLVRAPQRRLATSDQPVIVWPLNERARRPEPVNPDIGVTESLEVFVPLGPDLLLLMSWADGLDTPQVARGDGRLIRTANAFVVANADAQWFHEPGVEPWIAAGARQPLSATSLDRRYSIAVARSSDRRRRTTELANAEAAKPLSNDPVEVLIVAPPT